MFFEEIEFCVFYVGFCATPAYGVKYKRLIAFDYKKNPALRLKTGTNVNRTQQNVVERTMF